MAEEIKNNDQVETQDRGMFDFLKKKDEAEKPVPVAVDQEGLIAADFEEKVHVSEPVPVKVEEEEEKKHVSLLDKLHRSDSSSSSSSDEEEAKEGEEKKKKKKEKKVKKVEEDTSVPVEKIEGEQPEKKGIIEKIKEKLPGQGKKPEEHVVVAPVEPEHVEHPAEKKGILEKIKEKIPGYHPKASEEDKEKVKKESD